MFFVLHCERWLCHNTMLSVIHCEIFLKQSTMFFVLHCERKSHCWLLTYIIHNNMKMNSGNKYKNFKEIWQKFPKHMFGYILYRHFIVFIICRYSKKYNSYMLHYKERSTKPRSIKIISTLHPLHKCVC